VIGVLALQGGFSAHCHQLERLGRPYREVRRADELEGLSALILPGGESTTMLKLLKSEGLDQEIKRFCESGRPILATCAGAILLSDRVIHPDQDSLKLLPATIERNAYGCQRESFQTVIDAPAWELHAFPVYFIRAPRFTSIGPGVQTLVRVDDDIAGVTYRNLTAITFHPELADEVAFHQAWIKYYL